MFLLAVAAMTLTGCELLESSSSSSSDPVYTQWMKHSAAPIEWRISTSRYRHIKECLELVEIRSIASGKLHVTGVCTRTSFAKYIDQNQPGAFQYTIYPGDTRTVFPDGVQHHYNLSPGTVYLKVQDYMVE